LTGKSAAAAMLALPIKSAEAIVNPSFNFISALLAAL
jgi:hypothetical protein